MFVIKQAGVGIATMGDLKTNARKTVAATKDARIYLLSDGKPVAGLISLRLMALLEELLEDEASAAVAMERHAAVESGDDTLLEADAFFAAAEQHYAAQDAVVPAAVRGGRERPAKPVGSAARAASRAKARNR